VLHHHRIGGVGNAESICHPEYVTVDWKAGHTKGVAKHDIRGLPTDTGQRNQRTQISGDLPPVPLDNGPGHPDERASLGAKEAGRPNEGLEPLRFDHRHRTGVRIACEQRRCHLVHTFISALC
jgi:hypothetical protein